MSSTETEDTQIAVAPDGKKLSFIGRIMLFIRQVFGELKKVVSPTRKELINYFFVVLGFVVIMMAFVWVIDQLFGFIAVLVFGRTA